MNLFGNLFGNMFKSMGNRYKSQAEAEVRQKTVGKAQAKVVKAQHKIDDKVYGAQDRMLGKKKPGAGGKKDDAKGKKSKGKGLFGGKGKKADKVKAGKVKAGKVKNVKAPKGGGVPGGSSSPAMINSQNQQGQGMASNSGFNNGMMAGVSAYVCPNGHPMDPSWDMCPKCAQIRQGGYGGDMSAGQQTQAIDITQFEEEQVSVVGWIVALGGNHKGQDFRLRGGKNVIGTAADCEIVITDPYLSAKHSTIRYDNGSFILIDLDSTNGTYVNKKRVMKAELIDNDTVRLGKTEFRFKSLY